MRTQFFLCGVGMEWCWICMFTFLYSKSGVDSEQDKNLDPLPEFNDVFTQVNAVWYIGTIIKLTHLVVIVLQIKFNYRYDIHQLCKIIIVITQLHF